MAKRQSKTKPTWEERMTLSRYLWSSGIVTWLLGFAAFVGMGLWEYHFNSGWFLFSYPRFWLFGALCALVLAVTLLPSQVLDWFNSQRKLRRREPLPERTLLKLFMAVGFGLTLGMPKA